MTRQAVVPREGAVSVAFISAGVVSRSPTVGPGCSLVAIVQLPAYPPKEVLTHVGSAGQPAPVPESSQSSEAARSGLPHLMSYVAFCSEVSNST